MRRWMIGLVVIMMMGCGADSQQPQEQPRIPGQWKMTTGTIFTFASNGKAYIDPDGYFLCWQIEGDYLRLGPPDHIAASASEPVPGTLYLLEFEGPYMMLTEGDERPETYTRVSDDETFPASSARKPRPMCGGK